MQHGTSCRGSVLLQPLALSGVGLVIPRQLDAIENISIRHRRSVLRLDFRLLRVRRGSDGVGGTMAVNKRLLGTDSTGSDVL